MALMLTGAGRELIAAALFDRPHFLALGAGSAAWDASGAPALSPTDAALVAPVAYIRPRLVEYVTPQQGGAIITNEGAQYAPATAPSAYLHFWFVMDFDEGAADEIREIALASGAEFMPHILPAQNYIPANAVTAPGALWMMERVPVIHRGGLRLEIRQVIAL